jgi:carboxyl-terminal processing protease
VGVVTIPACTLNEKNVSFADSLGIVMQHRFKLCATVIAVCLLIAPSFSPGQESVTPSSAETSAVDLDELARKAEAIMALILEHHIDPGTPAEMWLAGTRQLQAIVLGQLPYPVAPRHLPPLETSELRREFLVRSLPRERLASWLAANSRDVADLLNAFVVGMTAHGASLKSALEIKREESLRANRYVGTGISLNYDKASGYPAIHPLPGGPMERAGGKQNDRIVRIDDHDAHRMPVMRAIELLSGDEGSTVTLELRGESATATRTVVVTRGHIQLPSLAGIDGSDPKLAGHRVKLGSPIRYVRVAQIKGSTVHELRQLERMFRSDGERAIILDFRGTEDSDLHHALLLADALMDGGTIGRLRTKERVQEFHADRERLFRDMPLAVLVDQDTSGSGEWVAAALQDNHAAVIVGGQTAGYSFVSTFVPIPGEDGFLQVPTAAFERPSGQPFQRPVHGDQSAASGIVPDRIVPTVEEEPTIPGVFELAQQFVRRRVKPGAVSKKDVVEAAVEELTKRIEAVAVGAKP